MPKWQVLNGDNREVLKQFEDNSIDAIVTDPPAGIEFMGKDWDSPWANGFTSHGFTDGATRVPAPTQRLSTRNPMCQKCHKHIRGTDGCRCEVPAPDEDVQFVQRVRIRQRQAFIASMTSIFAETLRVLKPGGHALVWALPRTSHWTATALEDAGFELRDCITHLFGAGFPKSLDVSKAIDKAIFVPCPVCGGVGKALNPKVEESGKYWLPTPCERCGGYGTVQGAEREVVGVKPGHEDFVNRTDPHSGGSTTAGWHRPWQDDPSMVLAHHLRTAPATPEAAQWEGWGTGLKPAAEFWWLARKPISEATIQSNVLKWGVGALNIDGCRIESGPSSGGTISGRTALGQGSGWNQHANRTTIIDRSIPAGRWPANVVLSHHSECVEVGTKQVKPLEGYRPNPVVVQSDGQIQFNQKEPGFQKASYTDADGMETVSDWECHPDCPVRLLDEQAGPLGRSSGTSSGNPDGHGIYSGKFPRGDKRDTGYGDTGGPSRYFYCAKPSRSEREAGLEGMEPDKRDLSRNADQPSMNGGDGNPYNRGAKPVLNVHPTVKSVSLCAWLSRLICPPGGTILDPFAGSGSIGVAAILEGFNYVGIELDGHYSDIARRRLVWAEQHPEVFAPKKKNRSKPRSVVSEAEPAPAIASPSVIGKPKAVRKSRADDQQEFPW